MRAQAMGSCMRRAFADTIEVMPQGRPRNKTVVRHAYERTVHGGGL